MAGVIRLKKLDIVIKVRRFYWGSFRTQLIADIMSLVHRMRVSTDMTKMYRK